MIRLLADENFNGVIFRGLLRRIPKSDAVRIQDCGLSGASDADVLSFAAAENRVIVTHDVRTFSRFAYQRVERAEAMPGAFEVPQSLPASIAIMELTLVIICSVEGEWEGQLRHLPL